MTRPETFTWQDWETAAFAGWSYNPATETPERGRLRSRLASAREMHAYRCDPDAYVEWVPSDLPWDGDVPYDGPLWDALLYVGDELCESLGCIAVRSLDDPYCRIVEGELYGALDYRREANTVRGVN